VSALRLRCGLSLSINSPLGGRHAAVTAAVTTDDQATTDTSVPVAPTVPSQSGSTPGKGKDKGTIPQPSTSAGARDHGGGGAERQMDDRGSENTSSDRGTRFDKERLSPSQHAHPPQEGPSMPSLPSIDSFVQRAPQTPSSTPHSPASSLLGNGQMQSHYAPSSQSSVPSGLRGLINPYPTAEGHAHHPSGPTEYSRPQRESRRRRESSPHNNGSKGHT
jgi:hypothetical protein